MKYRLSTLLLLIVIAALALGWYVDHRDRSRRDIIGTWHYPTPDMNLIGYATSLVIRPDGTFRKSQMGRFSTITFEGKYSIDKEGRVVFHVQSKHEETDLPLVPKSQPERLQVDYKCRCAIDKSGFLIVAEINPILKGIEGDCGISWEQTFHK